ncbi:Gfo/Idh/MocA family oxidoreductase [Streptosporangium sp. NPDC001681]|uniref:Gfo/Idh/MocA family protein n=1 Tax=Streptosporangium sp. NPDC001681 TaxID=3154395 RepID=UPI003328BC90
MIRVAVVGTGGIAGICHLPALRTQSHRARVVAAADTDEARVRAFCTEHAIPRAYPSLEAMLDAERPDLVHLCTPPHLHAAQARICLKAGAWVWIEKPACRSLAEYDLITSAEGPGYASVVSQHRFGSGARHLRALAPELGRALVALCVTAWYRDHAYFEAPWRGRWETEGGGPTMGHGIHQMDLMLSILGDWSEIRAMTGTLDRRIETEDVSMAAVRFASGAMASVVNSVLSRRQESYLRFDYTEATVELRHLYGYRNADWRSTSARWNPPADLPSSHEAQLAELLDAYERGERPPMSGPEGRRSLELITGLYASAFTGRPVLRTDLTRDHPFYHRLDGRAWS